MSASPTSTTRRTHTSIASAPFVIFLFVYALISWATVGLTDRIAGHASRRLPPARRSLLSDGGAYQSLPLQRSNITAFRRAEEEPALGLDHSHHLRLAQFRMRSGFYPATHPSEPYLVISDEETGAHAQTVEYGHDDHPLSRLADVREPREGDVESTFFFVLPAARGGGMKNILTNCYNLRRAEKREDPESLELVDGVVNVDVQSLKGLAKARSNNIVDAGAIDVFASSYFLEATLLFKPEHKGRAFAMLRHPVLRAETLYNTLASRRDDSGLAAFVESFDYIDNWVVRSLTNIKTGALSDDDLLVAKGILARKFLVGISEYTEETIKRLEMYYGWGKPRREDCVSKHLAHQHEREEKSAIERGSYEWEVIAAKDKYDLMLYYYALELFVKQGSTLFNRPYVDSEGDPIDFAELKKKKLLKEKVMAMMERGMLGD
ncbi:hypothetical protein ACHAXT_011262 [Thalassiosira profunda]